MYVIRRWEMHAERSDLYARARDAVPGDARYMAHGALYTALIGSGLRIVPLPSLIYGYGSRLALPIEMVGCRGTRGLLHIAPPNGPSRLSYIDRGDNR